jgi:hypothetical protein
MVVVVMVAVVAMTSPPPMLAMIGYFQYCVGFKQNLILLKMTRNLQYISKLFMWPVYNLSLELLFYILL